MGPNSELALKENSLSAENKIMGRYQEYSG